MHSVHRIRGDDVEQYRRQLETNPIINDISLPLSDVEYPRHNSVPDHDEFVSFDHSHPWSYRTGDDEGGLNPYTGMTVSTAAHHASALTLSAGLGNGRNARSELSISGAEYDPERPVQDILAGANSRHSLFASEASKSRDSAGLSYDPLVVDSTSELDRVLQSGYARPIPRNSSPQPSYASSESDADAPSRSKLSQALTSVGFSPRRPRDGSPHVSHARLPPIQDDVTPKPLRSKKQVPSQSRLHPATPVRPPTPSTTTSQFTKVARGLARAIETEVDQTRMPTDGKVIRTQRNSSHKANDYPERSGRHVVLPDVTGLTNAVESPMKGDGRRFIFPAGERPKDSEARILSTLTAVQSKLVHMESQNAIARRRVRELEMELETCKEDVRRERTRVLESEEVDALRSIDDGAIARRSAKGKAKEKSREVSFEFDRGKRYREVVEEKKALEALLASLRSHLKRLTSEVSSHRVLLTELKISRDSDVKRIKDKEIEVQRLSKEVERLAGEVEVLKGVVEEGLRERRSARERLEQSIIEDPAPKEEEGKGVDDGGNHTHSGGDEAREEAGEEDEPLVPAAETLVGDAPDHEIIQPSRRADQGSMTGFTNPRRIGGASTAFSKAVEREEISGDEPHSPPASPPEQRCVHKRTDGILVPSTSCRAEEPYPSRPRNKPSDPAGITPTAVSPAELATPFPQIRGKHLERLFFIAPEHDSKTCTVCHRKRKAGGTTPISQTLKRQVVEQRHVAFAEEPLGEDEGFVEGSEDGVESGPGPKNRSKGKQREHAETVEDATRDRPPPQIVLVRVVKELEDDFTHYKAIYVELAEQYRVMDAISNVSKRNILAQHLKEVVDVLEQKGNQIASLYDLLTYKDIPL